MASERTAGETAKQVADFMLQHDRASKHLGIKIESVDEGVAVLSMTVRDDMLNGLDILHGGFTFSLADSAFAFACNSRNRKTVALNCTINFVAAAKVGDILTATAREVSLSGRTGVYDVSVKNQKGELVAEFRGTSYGTSSNVV
ncbi:MAG TPA: hydroxyphenylacetyl-CoA thioesterase PaaI [Candidatus Melainabacteria bacterium]|jgi:acyl-CoA thioesterase|nr:hydroxyphenylacetyl-CoA thioesterase PaaI [Candidatus Melainabacteria bacterium]HIN65046.1 hydroxyphenylacetyl-CoA thioesterase PaaI [Candidatus Obscuribacterales bacterium]